MLSLEGAQRLERTACQGFSVQDTHPLVPAATAQEGMCPDNTSTPDPGCSDCPWDAVLSNCRTQLISPGASPRRGLRVRTSASHSSSNSNEQGGTVNRTGAQQTDPLLAGAPPPSGRSCSSERTPQPSCMGARGRAQGGDMALCWLPGHPGQLCSVPPTAARLFLSNSGSVVRPPAKGPCPVRAPHILLPRRPPITPWPARQEHGQCWGPASFVPGLCVRPRTAGAPGSLRW